jgi:hypothetical protein
MSILEMEVSTLEFLDVLRQPAFDKILKCSEVSELLKLDGSDAEHFLHCIFTMMFEPENSRDPFSPFFRYGRSHSPGIGDFNGNSMFCLAAACLEVKNPELRARICDLIWCEKKGSNVFIAHMAVDAYIESAEALIEAGESISAMRRIERALRLSYLLRRAPENRVGMVTDYVLKIINDDQFLGYPDRMLRLAYEFGIGELELLYSLSRQQATEMGAEGKYRAAIDMLELSVSCAKQLQDKAKEHEVYINMASCYEAEAESMPEALGCGPLMSAIEALRAVPETRERQEALFRKLRDHQRALQHSMITFSIPSGDLSELVNRSVRMVRGQDFIDSIFRLVLAVHSPTNIDKLRQTTAEALEGSIFFDLGAEHYDGDGLPIAVTPGVNDSTNAREIALENHLAQALKRDHQVVVRACLLPAIEEIANSYFVGKDGWAPFLINNYFVPRDHIEFYDRGLTAGLKGDFMLAAHILIPQIENSLRYVIAQSGQEPTRLFGNGDQDREGLKALLANPTIEQIFGKDATYALKTILTDKVYGDLRNQISHGYISSNEANGDASVMLWWIVLWILALPYRDYWAAKYSAEFFAEWPRRTAD